MQATYLITVLATYLLFIFVGAQDLMDPLVKRNKRQWRVMFSCLLSFVVMAFWTTWQLFLVTQGD